VKSNRKEKKKKKKKKKKLRNWKNSEKSTDSCGGTRDCGGVSEELHKGHAMHAASLYLSTFTIWLTIIVTFLFLLDRVDLTLTRPHKINTSASLLTYPHGACHRSIRFFFGQEVHHAIY
jgi:hypothetical protein